MSMTMQHEEGGRERVYEAISNARRRTVMLYLHEHGGTLKGELAERVAEEHDTSRKAAIIGLHQSHLDTMDSLGVVEYDERSGQVEPGPLLDLAAGAIEFVEDR